MISGVGADNVIGKILVLTGAAVILASHLHELLELFRQFFFDFFPDLRIKRKQIFHCVREGWMPNIVQERCQSQDLTVLGLHSDVRNFFYSFKDLIGGVHRPNAMLEATMHCARKGEIGKTQLLDAA